MTKLNESDNTTTTNTTRIPGELDNSRQSSGPTMNQSKTNAPIVQQSDSQTSSTPSETASASAATASVPTHGADSSSSISGGSSSSSGSSSIKSADNESVSDQTDEEEEQTNKPLKTESADNSPSRTSNSKQKPTSSQASASASVERADQAKGTTHKKKKGTKKDRSKLRKGKWTVEEEEYTSKILYYIKVGLLALPEGATPRSYLAEKLNCDPMRITKKFTGACCLGRRVYHLRERPHVSHADIEMAKADLEILEQRFRMRIEQDHSGAPLSTRGQDLLLAQQPSAVNNLYPAAAGTLPNMAAATWLKSLVAAQSTGRLPTPTQQNPLNPLGNPAWNLQSLPNQWLAPNTMEANRTAFPPASAPPDQSTLNNTVSSLAWVQAAASLTPALQQLAAATMQQQQLRLAYEEQVKAVAAQSATADAKSVDSASPVQAAADQAVPAETPTGAVPTPVKLSATEKLQRSYEAHLRSIGGIPPAATVAASKPKEHKSHIASDDSEAASDRPSANKLKRKKDASSKGSGSNNQEAGLLLDFVKSLRQSYEDAVDERPAKTPSPTSDAMDDDHRKDGDNYRNDSRRYDYDNGKPIRSQPHHSVSVVTDTSTQSRSETSSGNSSQPNESASSSSTDDTDSKSGKSDNDNDNDKMETASEEEHEAELTTRKGPPRKRHKRNRQRPKQRFLEQEKEKETVAVQS